MKILPTVLFTLLMTAASSFATGFLSVSFSAVVSAPNSNGTIAPIVINNSVLIAAVVANNPNNPVFTARNLIVAIQTGTGDLYVIRRDTSATVIEVLTVGTTEGSGSNTAGSVHDNVSDVTLDLPIKVSGVYTATTFTGAQYSTSSTTTGDTSLNSAHTSFFGGTGTAVLRGSYVTTGLRF